MRAGKAIPEIGSDETGEERFRRQFGKNVWSVRVLQKISQEELARRAGIHRTQISLIETGQRLVLADSACRLASSLGVTVDRLYRGIDWVPADPEDKSVPGFYEFYEVKEADPERITSRR